MDSMRPYLIRAVYEWCLDNNLTPYIIAVINDRTKVPLQYVDGGQIVLNLNPKSVGNLSMTNMDVSFNARFSGVSHHIYLPVDCIYGIYSKENGQGMFFDHHDRGQDDHEVKLDYTSHKELDKNFSKKPKKSHLKLIK